MKLLFFDQVASDLIAEALSIITNTFIYRQAIASNAGGLPKAKIGLLYYILVKTVTGERYPNTIASNAGGLPKAKIGLPYYILVKTVTGERHPNSDYIVWNLKQTRFEIFKEEGYAGGYRTFEKEGYNI
ncbi:hypothetical protein BT67DRAFT_437442 [Trichocladium antarcticum]|uniref:Uncharacterized protein n=1 Tax=Trichocladium antarcticum TaxID=1450529 RepID=A0AAN6ZA38_9PEZI|nr:hypothetical protein BT67DRAFT_437442 [Trichocladium antarcticum]